MGDAAIADRGELAGEQRRRRAMLIGRPVDVDHDDLAARDQSRADIPQEGIGLGDLVIHVHEDGCVERSGGQARIVRFT